MKLLPLLLPLLLFCAGCAGPAEPAYDPADFSCMLAIDSVSTGEEGRFTGQYVSAGDRATLVLTGPERLAGVTFVFSEAGCTLSVGETPIPLSGNTAASLQTLADLLRAGPDTAVHRKNTADGTVLVYEAGQLTLDEAGFPVLVQTTEGRRASVVMQPAEESQTPN